MNTKIYLFLYKIGLFLVNYHVCYFVFIEFEYYMKLSICLDDENNGPDFRGGLGTDKILDFRGGASISDFSRGGGT